MKPAVQSVVVSAHRGDRENGATEPRDPEHFARHLMVFVVSEGETGSDRFDLIVCSPSWFAEQAVSAGWNEFGDDGFPTGSVVSGRGIWFMQRWDRTEIDGAIESVVARGFGAPDWTTAALRINEEMPWEYDYRHRG